VLEALDVPSAPSVARRSIRRVAPRSDSLVRPFLVFGLLALLALALVAGTGIVVVREVATDQALAEARQLTEVSARLVERRLTEGLRSRAGRWPESCTTPCWSIPSCA
jgi:hypothetical protein